MLRVAALLLLRLLTGACVCAQPAAVQGLQLRELETQIAAGKFPKLTSLLVSREGHLLYEAYFGAGGRDHLNNTRSATKSLTALVVGRAIEDGKIENAEARVLPFFSDLAPSGGADPIKEDIRLKDLLTMSSAFAADDSDRGSPGNEDRMHEQKNWTRWIVDLSVRQDYQRNPSGYGPFRYATVNAVLAGQVVQRATGRPVDAYMADVLFTPLGITQYTFQKSPSGEVMTGGGIELRAIDLWKIGQLVLDGGRYAGRQLIPASWVTDCLTAHETDTGHPGTGYGYLFWHLDFPNGERRESGWYMAGNGGNMILMLPALKAVVVITRTAYNSPTARQDSFSMVSSFVLPALTRAALPGG